MRFPFNGRKTNMEMRFKAQKREGKKMLGDIK